MDDITRRLYQDCWAETLTVLVFIWCAIIPWVLAYGAAIAALTFALFKKAKTVVKRPADYGVDELPGVSIVIPFRNEERNLEALLGSLGKQSYKGMMEVILVNDQSGDNWENVVNEYRRHNDHITIKIIDLHVSNDAGLTSKQQALDLGVDNSSYPLIAFTDADMVLAPNWVETLVDSHLSTGADLVFGHTAIRGSEKRRTGGGIKGDSIFTLMEAYQLEYLFTFAYTFSKLNLTGSCMGNNVLIAKSAYRQIGGQRGIGYSIVEDRALLQAMRKNGFKTAASEPFTVTAETYPSPSVKQFYSQMARWARGGLRPGGGLFIAGLLLLAQNVWLPLSMITAWGFHFLTVLPAVNFLLTWAFLALAFRKNGASVPAWLFPAYYVFMMIETAVFGISLIFTREIRWKGRNFGKF